MYKRIISESPGCIFYKGAKEGENLCYFTDVFQDPISEGAIVIPGRGAIINRISSFFFSRLAHVGMPSHFMRSSNMRTMVLQDMAMLPFEVHVFCTASKEMAMSLGLSPGHVFDRPIFDFRHRASGRLINDTHILACQWVTAEGLDDLQMFLLRLVDFLRGMMVASGLLLNEIRLSLGNCFGAEGQEMFYLCGEISPETFCVEDLETQELLGGRHITTTLKEPVLHYRRIATRLGLYLGGPHVSRVLPFSLAKVSRKHCHDQS